MLHIIKKIFCLIILGLSCSQITYAQTHHSVTKTREKKTLPKFPVFTTYLGGQKSDTISLDKARQLVDSSLVAVDKKKKLYKIVEFDFGYLHTDTTFNDTTEVFKLIHEYFGYTFHSDQLDSLWRTRIAEELQPGEKLYFDNIVAIDDKGKKYRTPPVHLVIQEQN
jgi:hypothetical protein